MFCHISKGQAPFLLKLPLSSSSKDRAFPYQAGALNEQGALAGCPSRAAALTQPQPTPTSRECGPRCPDLLILYGTLETWTLMWNVSIFKKLTQLFLKRYVGQQNISVGCQFVTFVLKQDHCSLSVSFCLSFANIFPALPWRTLSPLNLAPPWSAACHVPLGLSCAFHPILNWALSPCLGLLHQCVLFTP